MALVTRNYSIDGGGRADGAAWMRKDVRVHTRGLLWVMAATGLGAFVLVAPAEDRGSIAAATPHPENLSTDDADARATPTQPRIGRIAIAVQDPDTTRWNEMAPAERIDDLTESFRRAVDGLERDRDVDRNLEIAEAALTALRSELYSSPQGRERHQTMEAELDDIVRRRSGGQSQRDEP